MSGCEHCNPKHTGERPPLNRMMLADWYDGPSDGLLICDQCGAAYHFLFVDWNASNALRVFALQQMPDDTVKRAQQLFNETPTWPTWFPSRLKHPSEADQSLLQSWDRMVAEAGPYSVAILWDNRSHTCLRARHLSDEMAQNVVYLPESENFKAFADWFSFLQTNR